MVDLSVLVSPTVHRHDDFKDRIAFDGLREEHSIAELCRREGISRGGDVRQTLACVVRRRPRSGFKKDKRS